jgi:hypothetical protein
MCILNIETFENCRHGRISTTKCEDPEKQADADKLPPIIVPASTKKQQDAIKKFLDEFGYEVFKCKRYERSEKIWLRANCYYYGGFCADAVAREISDNSYGRQNWSPAAKGKWYEDDVKGMELNLSGQSSGLVVNRPGL